MASETTTSGAGSANPTIIDEELILEIRESVIALPLFDMVDLTNMPGLSYTFPDLTSTTSLTPIGTGANEADAVANSELTTSARTATAASKAAYVTISDLNMSAATVDWRAATTGILARAAADLMDVDALALLSSFSLNAAGSTAVALSVAALRAAVTSFRTNAKAQSGLGVIVLHPTAIGQIEAELQSGTGAGLASVFVNSDLAKWFQSTPGTGVLQSYRGNYSGIPVLSSTNCPSINSNVDWGGAIFARQAALGGVLKWQAQVRWYDAGVNRQLAQVAQVRTAYGFVEKKDALGISITSVK